MQPNMTIEQAKKALSDSRDYQTFRDELLQNFYWKAGDYVIVLSIIYNDTKTQPYKFKFSINTSEATAFKENIEKSLQCTIDGLYKVPTNMFCPQKDFIPDDEE